MLILAMKGATLYWAKNHKDMYYRQSREACGPIRLDESRFEAGTVDDKKQLHVGVKQKKWCAASKH